MGVLPGLDAAVRTEGGNESRASSVERDAEIHHANGGHSEIAPCFRNLSRALKARCSPHFWLLLRANERLNP